MREHIPGDVTWELVGLKGPGPMMVYSQGGLGKIVGDEWFRGTDGAPEGAFDIAPNTHVHPNWVFGEQGTYDVTIRQVAQTNEGKQVAGEATMHFVVGGDKPADASAGGDCGWGVAAGAGSSGGAGAGGSSTGGGQSSAAQGKGGALANTGTPSMPLGIGVLGLGMLFLGLGIARLAVAKAED